MGERCNWRAVGMVPKGRIFPFISVFLDRMLSVILSHNLSECYHLELLYVQEIASIFTNMPITFIFHLSSQYSEEQVCLGLRSHNGGH